MRMRVVRGSDQTYHEETARFGRSSARPVLLACDPRQEGIHAGERRLPEQIGKQVGSLKGCWAASLGDCRGKLTREHLISAAVFGRKAKLQAEGFPWCPQPKVVGINSLTGHVLCERHNSLLSEVDTAAAGAFKTFEQANDAVKLRTASGKPFNVTRRSVDGPRLEKWFLKTLFALHSAGSLPGGLNPQPPARELCVIAFGRAPLYGRSGLYMICKPGTLRLGPEVMVSPLYRGNEIWGALWHFYGWKMVFSLLRGELPKDFGTRFGLGASWDDPAWRFKDLEYKVGNRLSNVVTVEWPKSDRRDVFTPEERTLYGL